MKRIISGVVVVIMVMVFLFPALTAEALVYGDLYYTTSNDGVAVYGCKSTNGKLIIPAEIDGKPVIRIYRYLGDFRGNITSIVLPDTLLYIGSSAFSGLDTLVEINIPESVEYIDDFAFSGCSALSEIIIPDGVEEIHYGAFEQCTSLTSVSLSKSVAFIERTAFIGCDSLEGIWVDEQNPYYSNDRYGALYNKDKTTLLQVPGSLSEYQIPSTVTHIRDSAVAYCSGLTELSLPDGVTYISDHAFYQCENLQKVRMPDSVEYIGLDAFSGCNLELNSYNGVGYLGNEENPYCAAISSYGGRAECILHSQTRVIAGSTFEDCSDLTSIEIPEGVVGIGRAAFTHCGLSGITLPETITCIGFDAFKYCLKDPYIGTEKNPYYAMINPDETQDLTINPQTVLLAGGVFDNTYVSSIAIPEGVTSIGELAFFNCEKLKEIIIPDSVTEIGVNAFCWAEITEITIPASVTQIGEETFEYCWDLRTVRFVGDAPRMDNTVFASCKNVTAYYPADNPTWKPDLLWDYRGNVTWLPYEPEQVIPQTLSGNISAPQEAQDLTVSLQKKGNQLHSAVITDDTYRFETVNPGSYDLVISMTNGVKRVYPITVGDSPVVQDVSICLRGDANGDAKVNLGDVARIFAHTCGTTPITDEYLLLCADVNADGKTNLGDVARAFSHVKKTSLLW